MTPDATSAAQECVFCAIVTRRARAGVVHEDETSVAFMDSHPVTPGHLLVVPRVHGAGLEDLDETTSDGEAPYQAVFHFHLHVIPRHEGVD